MRGAVVLRRPLLEERHCGRLLKRSWRNAMAGTMDKIKGSVKDAVGSVTGDTKTQAEGKTDKAKGSVKGAAHEAKEGAKGVTDSLKK
jgi:uncharacterized protein YjbJ (UPF0337 family)